MIAWLAMNWGTILVLCILLSIVAAILFTLRRDRKLRQNSCGVHCAGCGGHCAGCAGGCHG